MSVAFGTTKSLAPANGTGGTSSAWAISGSNLAIVVHIGINIEGPTVSACTWSLGSGTAYQVFRQPDDPSPDAFAEIWAIPAPVAGSGTFTVTLSVATNFQITADYFTGCDQLVPCPVADAVGANVVTFPDGAPVTLTPPHVVAADAMAMNMTHTSVGDSNGFSTGTSTYESNTTPTNMLTGYRLGASPMVTNAMSAGTGTHMAACAVRIAAAAAAPPGTLGQYETHHGGRGAGW